MTTTLKDRYVTNEKWNEPAQQQQQQHKQRACGGVVWYISFFFFPHNFLFFWWSLSPDGFKKWRSSNKRSMIIFSVKSSKMYDTWYMIHTYIPYFFNCVYVSIHTVALSYHQYRDRYSTTHSLWYSQQIKGYPVHTQYYSTVSAQYYTYGTRYVWYVEREREIF